MTSTTIVAAPGTDLASRPPRFKYLEWGPVVAGAIGAAAISLVLFTFGSAIGLSIVSPWPNHGMSATAFMVIAALFAAIVQVGSFAAGGYLAGRMRTPWLAGAESEQHFRDGSYGFAVWALGLLIGAAIAVSGATGALKTAIQSTAVAAGATAAGAASAAPGMMNRVGTDPSDYAIDLLMRPAPTATAAATPTPGPAATDTAAARPDAERDLRAPLTRIFVSSLQNGSLAANDRTYLAQVVARQTGLSQADAEARVDQAYAEAKNAEAKARAAADKARKLGMIAAFLAAATLAIGCAAACAGAGAGGRARDEQIPARWLGSSRFW